MKELPLKADLFLYCYEREFMSNLQTFKQFDIMLLYDSDKTHIEGRSNGNMFETVKQKRNGHSKVRMFVVC